MIPLATCSLTLKTLSPNKNGCLKKEKEITKSHEYLVNHLWMKNTWDKQKL